MAAEPPAGTQRPERSPPSASRQIDEVMSGSSYYSQNDLRLHFGLGRATTVETVELAWPSGAKETCAICRSIISP